MEINLHGFFLEDAKIEILSTVDACKELGDNIIKFIHGHKHGTAIRDYLRCNHFLNDIAKAGHKITNRDFSDNGASTFQFSFSRTFVRKKRTTPKPASSENVLNTKITVELCNKCKKPLVPVEGFNWYKCPDCGKLKKRII